MRQVSSAAASAALLVGFGQLAAALPSFQGKVLARDSQLLSAYDYVVVGGGVSGLTVANRLSEDSGSTVLVIEAGIFPQGEDYLTVPGLAGNAVGTKYDWNVSYVPHADVADRAISIPLGKVLGGSSLLNRMLFLRGSSADYNRWESLGLSGWGWDTLLQYFRKSEIFTPPDAEIEAEWNITYDLAVHGSDGYVHSSYSPFIWPSTKSFIDAMKELDVNIPEDGASGQAVGGFWVPHAQNPATAARSDARLAYYDSAVNRTNYHVLTGHQVTRIVTESSNNTISISGVEFAASSASKRITVKVKKEAIMAAGAVHTPQILQLSGIGDPALLSQHNITTVATVPGVGHNFQDHILLATVHSFDFPLTTTNLTSNATYAAEMRALYDSERVGPYSDATGDFLTFLPTKNYTTLAESIYDDAQQQDANEYLDSDTPSTVAAGYSAQHALLTEGLLADDEAKLEVLWTDGTMILGLEHPFSRGSVKLASTDPFVPPLADSGFLRNPVDLRLLVEGVKYTRTVAATAALQAFNPVEILPGANVTADADIEDFIRQNTATLFHPVGSCSAGKLENGGVVDENFKVYGVQNLRIVDASVFPLLPATHTQSSVYALAEMAAVKIKSS